jgi:predicted transcriptional regulator
MKQDVANLGELEMAVLEHVWETGPTDVKTAHERIGPRRGITHNTVQSTFKRLWEKGLFSRAKQGHAYIYDARVDRRQLTELMVASLVDQVAGSEIGVALEAFVNLADRAGDDTLDELEALIAARRNEPGHDR